MTNCATSPHWGAEVTGVDMRSDEALLAAVAVGDEMAGIAFVRRYQRRVYGLALSIVGDSHTAEDIAQEALVRAWRYAAVYDSRRASVATWLLTITRNLAIDQLRLRRATPIDPEEILRLGQQSPDPDPSEEAQKADATSRVRAALACVPSEQRRAVLLAAFHGLTAREIAAEESIPLGTAKTRIRAGLGKVRALLDTSGLGAGPSPVVPVAGPAVATAVSPPGGPAVLPTIVPSVLSPPEPATPPAVQEQRHDLA
jgi:RNA polymerase sigma factor (sigma-70 family)